MSGEISAAAVVAAREDMQPTGETYLELAMTGSMVAAVSPHGRRVVAGFLQALLNREPMLSSTTYAAHREILGSLCLELEAAAIRGALDEPAPVIDLRDPAIAAREHELLRQTREWADSERARRSEAAHARIDDMLDVSAAEHERAAERLDEAVREAEAFLAAPAAPEPDDASAWLF